jgi:membrane associated rhomboid family serine protease
MFLIAILVLLGAVYYFTTPEEKKRFVRAVVHLTREALVLVERYRPKPGPFDDALRGRTSWVVATPALAAVNTGVFLCLLLAPGALSDPETLVQWGGSVGPRTTQGEWWRLLTATFAHTSLLHLLVNVAALVQIGIIMERLFGRVAFAGVYLAAGLMTSIVHLAMHPITVSAGGSGSVFGVLGLLLTWLVAGTAFRSTLAIPLKTIFTFCPAVAMFILYSMAAGFDGLPEMAGLAVGVVSGLVLAKDVEARTPPLLRIAATMGAVALIAVPSVVPLRGLTDVRPELQKVAAIEQRTASIYDRAVGRFTKGEIQVNELAALIDGTILPELQIARAHLGTLKGVPREHEPMVAGAREYFTLREKGWRVRADALRKVNRATLRQADEIADEALRALAEVTEATETEGTEGTETEGTEGTETEGTEDTETEGTKGTGQD